MEDDKEKRPGAPFDVVIVGAGVSGTALLYALARYGKFARIALVEKYENAATVNSHARNNSQTLHVGDIETNYSMEKVRELKPAASMVARYALALSKEKSEKIIFPVQKMILAVGGKEAQTLADRYEKLKEIFPKIQKLDRAGIERDEPEIVRGRKPDVELLALRSDGFAVDYQMLARSFVEETLGRKDAKERVSLFLGNPVANVARDKSGVWSVELRNGGKLRSRAVVFDADSYSLLFAKRLGYGREFSLIPVAGTFFFSKRVLNGKVYTVQDPRLPFSAVHGDPDVRVPDMTRWGPTARFFPVLEARNWKTSPDYFKVSGLHRWQTWFSFVVILLDPLRFVYLARNLLYEIPYLGAYFFAKQAQKIAPSLRGSDFARARGFGGMRLQRVNTKTHGLLLGEGKIIGDNIIFNMTPSPGASVCLYNAMRDAEQLARFFGGISYFNKELMTRELCVPGESIVSEDLSLKETYAS